MLGAIIGDIVGSTREWNNIKREDFELVPQDSRFTDDTVMTLAVAEWLMTDPTHGESSLVKCMQELGRKYPNAGYGGMFRRWLRTESPQPYGSFGNGSDYGTPHSIKETRNLLQKIEELRDKEGYIYIHSRKGSGRTGTIVACMSAQCKRIQKSNKRKKNFANVFHKCQNLLSGKHRTQKNNRIS